jgi:hypothetical protein
MELKNLIREATQAARDLVDRRLWTRFSNNDCLAVKVSGCDEPVLAIVMGEAGEQFGLSLFRGRKAAATLAALFNPDGPGDDVAEDMDMLGFTMDTFGDLTPEAQEAFRAAGLHPRYEEQVPSFLAKRPGRQPRLADESELTLLLMAARGVIEADKRGLLYPTTLEAKEGLCALALGGDPAAPEVSVTRERWQPEPGAPAAPPPFEAADLAGLPRLEATWLVGLPAAPTGIEGDDRGLQLLLVADEASGLVLLGRPLFVGDLHDAIDAVVSTFRSGGLSRREGLPRKIVFSSRKLYEAMAPALQQAGVTCLYEPQVPKLQALVDEFLEFIGEDRPPLSEFLEEAAPAPAGPAPDDLAGWKEADRRVSSRFAQAVRTDDRFRSARAAKRYFDDEDLDYFLEANKDLGVHMAYSAWVILDYRPTRKSKTLAEKMLAEGLPEDEAILVRARLAAYPTLYRVAGHDPGAGTVDLEDVLLGGAVTVHDRLMSENIDDGVFVAARTYPAGRFHFLELAGPPLGLGMGMEAVEFLEDCGMEFTPDGLRDGAHVFGWLWIWSDEWEENRPRPHLQNMDGDDLLWHTASFQVADPAAVRQAVLQRDDIRHDEGSGEIIWVRTTGQAAERLGGPVTLGRIEFVGDELVLTVNSAKRLEAARLWLEKVPGVAFRNVATRRWDEPDENRPMDERISKPEPVKMTPELNAALQEMLDRQYMRWLDTPLPVLGGKTPRETCRTPDGRQQVAMMIRTIPEPMGPGHVRVPRQEMLRGLGLDAEFSAAPVPNLQMPPLPGPVEPAFRGKKVGRNDACPCGSGKKYKKCCGRQGQPR